MTSDVRATAEMVDEWVCETFGLGESDTVAASIRKGLWRLGGKKRSATEMVFKNMKKESTLEAYVSSLGLARNVMSQMARGLNMAALYTWARGGAMPAFLYEVKGRDNGRGKSRMVRVNTVQSRASASAQTPLLRRLRPTVAMQIIVCSMTDAEWESMPAAWKTRQLSFRDAEGNIVREFTRAQVLQMDRQRRARNKKRRRGKTAEEKENTPDSMKKKKRKRNKRKRERENTHALPVVPPLPPHPPLMSRSPTPTEYQPVEQPQFDDDDAADKQLFDSDSGSDSESEAGEI